MLCLAKAIQLLPLPEAIDEGINDMPQTIPSHATITYPEGSLPTEAPQTIPAEAIPPEEGAELLERAHAIPTCGRSVAH